MSYWIDHKYISMIAPRIQLFTWKSTTVGNGRCPVCGDSQTNKRKKRFYIYFEGGKWHVYCHNCDLNTIFPNFLSTYDPRLYSEYSLDKLNEKRDNRGEVVDLTGFVTEKPQFATSEIYSSFIKLKKISQLPFNHPAKEYILSRQIPNFWHSQFRWIPKFGSWINEHVQAGKFDDTSLQYDEGRIAIPVNIARNKLIAIQGRRIDAVSQSKYMSIHFDESAPLIWGTNRINLDKDIFVFEGVFDALFIPNSIAILGGNFSSLTKVADVSKMIMVYDNEPHSSHTKKKIATAIEAGFRVAFFPKTVLKKDINALVINGISCEKIEKMIRSNTFLGLQASIKLNEWSKR